MACRPGYSGAPAVYYCRSQVAGFQGVGPSCVSTTTTTRTTTSLPALCTAGIPSGLGINNSDCAGKYNGATCIVGCMGAYLGDPKTYYCNAGVFVPMQGNIACQKRRCGPGLPSGPYDTKDCSGKEVGQFCTVTCMEGYKPAPSFFACNESGWFSGTAGSCVRLPCDTSGKPRGTGVNSTACDGKLAGESCNVTCAAGYVGDEETVVCGMDGMFSGRFPTCRLMPCTLPAALSASNFSHTCSLGGVVVASGQSCSVGCARGYTGRRVDLFCKAPNLVGALPSCTPKECTSVPWGWGLDASQCNGRTTGETCALTCLPGYEADNVEARAVCQANGAFTRSSLKCTRRHCNVTALADDSGFNATLDTDGCLGAVSGDDCTVSCSRGYYPIGGAEFQPLTCDAASEDMPAGGFVGADGMPPSAALQCIPRICTVGLPRKRGLLHDCTGKRTAESCTVWANPAFQYDDDEAHTLVCGPRGAFLGSTPRVVPLVCAVPDFPEGVGHTCTDKTLGGICWTYCDYNVAKYQCQMGVNGSGVVLVALWPPIACSPSRRMASAGGPRRLAGYCDAAAQAAGFTGEGIKQDCLGKASGESCIVECGDGYNISGSPSVYTCAASSLYTGPGLPTCEPQACTTNFPDGLGVVHNCSGAVTGGFCTARCRSGYAGTATQLSCQSTGELNGTSPSCEAVPCSALSLGPAFRTTACLGKATGDTCVVDCSNGWTANGSAVPYTCGASGNFSGAPPQCSPNVCTQGLPVGSDLRIGSTCAALRTLQTCTVACANGYAANSSLLTCTASGVLQGTTPTCTPQVCPSLTPRFPGILHTCNDVTFGSACVVTCKTGYQLRTGASPQDWQCSWNETNHSVSLQGMWPLCDPLPCLYNLPTGAQLVDNCTGVGTDGVCASSCAPGYAGMATELTCGSDATFHGFAASCVPQSCPARTIPQVQSTCQDALFGASCFASCAQGYTGSAQSWDCVINTASLGITISLQGPAPSCLSNPCLYNFPVGIEYTHTCAGIATDEVCAVQCSAEFIGMSQPFMCLSTGALNGTLPTCLARTSTHTTTGTTTTTIKVAATITGNLTLLVSDPAAFIADPQARAAVAASVATLVNVPVSYVSVSLALGSMRLLSAISLLRRLASAVVASYIIILPADLQVNVTTMAESIQASILNATTDQFTALIMAALPSGIYNVTVQEVSEPVFTETVADNETATAPEMPESRSVTLEGSNKSLSTATIVLAVLCGLSLCCCCGCAAYALERRRRAQQQPVPIHLRPQEPALDPILPVTPLRAGEAWYNEDVESPGQLEPRLPSKMAPLLQLPGAAGAKGPRAAWAADSGASGGASLQGPGPPPVPPQRQGHEPEGGGASLSAEEEAPWQAPFGVPSPRGEAQVELFGPGALGEVAPGSSAEAARLESFKWDS